MERDRRRSAGREVDLATSHDVVDVPASVDHPVAALARQVDRVAEAEAEPDIAPAALGAGSVRVVVESQLAPHLGGHVDDPDVDRAPRLERDPGAVRADDDRVRRDAEAGGDEAPDR